MADNQDKKEITGANDENEIQLVASIFNNIDIARSNVAIKLDNIKEYRRAYNCQARLNADEMAWEDAPNISIPFLRSSCLALTAELFPMLFDINPIVTVDTDLVSAEPVAHFMESMFQIIHKRKSDYIKKWKMAINMMLRDGSSIMMTTFDEDKGYEYRVIPINRFLVMPSFDGDIQEANAVAINFNVSKQWLINKLTDTKYSRSAVERVLKYSNADITLTPEDERDGITSTQMNKIRNDDKDIADMQTRTITEVYIRQEIASDDDSADTKYEEWIYTLHEPTMTLLKKMKNPYTGSRKFVCVKGYSSDVSIYGDCPASIGGYYAQGALDVLINTAVWQQIRQTDPRWAVPESTYKKLDDKMKKAEAKKPGARIPFEMDATGAQLFKTLEQGSAGNSLLDTFQSVSREAQGMFGVTDAQRGQQMQGAPTATESLQLVEGGKLIVSSITGNIGEAIAEHATQEYELMRQFKDSKYFTKLWDRVSFQPLENPSIESEGQVDEMGMPIPKVPVTPEPIPFDLCFFDEDGEDHDLFWFTSNGSFSTSKMIQAKRAMDRFGILAQCPEVQADRGLAYEVFSDVLHTMGDKNPEKFLGHKKEWLLRQIAQEEMQQAQAEMQLAQQQQMAMQQGGIGEEVPPIVDGQAMPVGV